MSSVFKITVWWPYCIVSMVTTGGHNYEMTHFLETPVPYPLNASYIKNHVQSGKKNLFCTVVSPLKKLKAHQLLMIQLSDFVRVVYRYVSTLCHKDFSVNGNILIL